MNVMLTGGAGYIGSHTAVALARAGHRVMLYDNLCNSRPEVASRVAELIGYPVSFMHGDVRDTPRLMEAMTAGAIEVVVHFAGLKAVGDSVAKPVEYFSANVQGAISLVQAMQACGVRTLVFSSSATVYGEPKYLPIDERHSTQATNPYGRTKLIVEEFLADVARSADDWRIICLRYFNPVGAHDSGLIGEEPAGRPNNLMPFLVKVAGGELPCLNIFGNDYGTSDGTGVRDYIHVMDLAEGHVAALQFLHDNDGWHVVNLGTGRGTSVLELVGAFERVTGRTVAYRFAPRRPGDVAACYAGVLEAERRLKWRAHRTLEDMCATAWRWQLRSVQRS